MKLLYTLALLTLLIHGVFAQVGIGTTTPNANAVLELKSPGNNQGFLLPRLSTAQRMAISLTSQENGLLVYDSDDQKFYYWQDTQWQPIRSGSDIALVAGSGIDITGNTISAIPDGDGSTTNEIQDLQLIGNTLSITNNASATEIDLAPFAGVNTDNQTLSFNASTGVLNISGGNTVTVTPAGPAGGVLSGSYPNPALATSAGNSVVAAVNNAATTTLVNANRLANTVVVDTESPAGGVISGTFSTGLQIVDNAITSAKIADGAVGSSKLSATGVTPGTYGAATLVPQLTVDAQGRVTGVSTVTISGVSPGGAASGDLGGAYPNPSIATTAGNNILNAVNNIATTGTIATGKLAGAVVLETESPVGGVITGNFNTGLQIADNAITSAKIVDGAVTTLEIADGAVTSAKLSATGVTPGTYGAATVVPRVTVDAQGRVTGVSTVTISGVAPGGAANGDLSGTYPNPSIATTAGNNIVTAVNNAATTTTIAANKLVGSVVLDSESPVGGIITGTFGTGLQIADNAITAAKIVDGAVTTLEIADGAVSAAKLSATGVTAGTYGAATLVPQVAVDAQGRVTGVSTVTISGVVPGGTATGDLAGTYPAPSIATTAGNNIVTAINNAGTSGTIAPGRLDPSVVLSTETPAASDISGSFTTGLTVNNNAVTTAKILDGAVTTAKIAPSTIAGQVLTTVGGSTVWSTLPALTGGTVTSVATGTGLTGGPITTTGTISVLANGITSSLLQSHATDNNARAVGTDHIQNAAITDVKLSSTGVTAGTYGSSTQIPTFTVNAQGRLTAAGNVAISNPIEGLSETLTASGDAKDGDAFNLRSVTISSGAAGPGPGALNVDGSHFVSFTIFTDGYVVQPKDYILINQSGTAKPTNIELPKAADNRGRILIIRSTGTSLNEAVTVTAPDLLDGLATSESLYVDPDPITNGNIAYSITIISDGTTWWTIDRAIPAKRG